MPVLDVQASGDAQISSSDPTTNYGTNVSLAAGQTGGASQRRSLLKFDISSLPVGATIKRAWLQLYCSGQADTSGRVINVHRCLEDWNEAEVTWNIRVTGTNWATAGGEAGTDYTATATRGQIIGRDSNFYVWNVVDDVDAWYQGTATNYGWWLINESQGTVSSNKFIASSEYSTSQDGRPRLIVVYDDGSTFSDPTDYSDCELWLSADSGVYSDAGTTPANDTDNVQEWHDQSGNNNDATQTTAGDKPVYSTGIQNGLPGILFDGSADNLEVDGVAASLSGTNQHMTCFMAVTPDNSSAQICPISVGRAASTNPRWRIQIETSGNGYVANVARADNSNNSFSTDTIIPITADAPYIITSVFVGDREAIGVNLSTPDNVAASIGRAATSTLDQARIGLRLVGAVEAVPFDGYIHEIIIYSRALSLEEIQTVERYLNEKWRILTESKFLAPYMGEPCIVPTYETGTSGQTVHPSVIDAGVNGWNGYRYWMANTPYPDGDDQYENPSIYVSSDKLIWEVPPGGSNPIDAYPGGSDHNSDTELFLAKDKTMYCFYRMADGVTYTIRVRSSTDGINWGSEIELYSGSNSSLSPAVIYDDAINKYVMYTIDSSGGSALDMRTAHTLSGTWSSTIRCSVDSIPDGRELWHLDVTKYKGNYIAIVYCVDASGVGITYMMTSKDGHNWYCDDHAVIGPRIYSGFDRGHGYRSTFLINGDAVDVWYAGNMGTIWTTGYMTMTESLPDIRSGYFPYHHRLR